MASKLHSSYGYDVLYRFHVTTSEDSFIAESIMASDFQDLAKSALLEYV